ncbi:hypothetical protein KFE25_013472 [Diacronema lutheri]|uniref:EF-hand domain-containing protein n=1 Tax=Diacronema lutheri TaxID=2081491 RepID=A0A8J5XQF9_DIALT|nr:hypothetical protein KFE25_013472 [Diacronema lutheri]
MGTMRNWTFTHLRSDLVLLVNGGFVDAAAVIAKYGGQNFTLQVGKHYLSFHAADEADPSRVTVLVNGAKEFVFRGALHMYATTTAVAFQQHISIPWPEHAEPRTGPPQLGGWVTTSLGKEVLSAAGVARPATAAFARRVRLVGILFFSEQSELSQKFVRRLDRCLTAGLGLDLGILAVSVTGSAEEAMAARAALPVEWAVLPHAQTARACAQYELRGVPSLVVVDAKSGRVVRTNAVVDVIAHADEPATVLKLCGIDDPTCWAREQAKRRAASSRLNQRVELRPEDLVQAFRSADRDRSGSVGLGELLGAFRALGLPVSEGTLALFRKHDVDGDNALDFAEFCVLCSQCRQLLQPRDPERRRLLAIFAESDVQNFGFVPMDEIVGCLVRAGLQTDLHTVCRVSGRMPGDGAELDFVEFAQLYDRLRTLAAERAEAPAAPGAHKAGTAGPAVEMAGFAGDVGGRVDFGAAPGLTSV